MPKFPLGAIIDNDDSVGWAVARLVGSADPGGLSFPLGSKAARVKGLQGLRGGGLPILEMSALRKTKLPGWETTHQQLVLIIMKELASVFAGLMRGRTAGVIDVPL